MRSLWFGVLVCAALFVACSDDDSDFATRPSDGSSSSVCEDCDDGSSSSVTPKSNDSETSVSSSSTKSSSSSAESSSSSQIGCKTETEDNCEYGELVDDRDGQTYKTVKIGNQWWMAENLNYETANSYCCDGNATNCAKYGRLYRWAAAVGKSESECGYDGTCSLPTGSIQGVCPSGWHLPRKYEWETLFDAVGGQTTAGMALKSASGWYNSGNGPDAFGFSALPAGSRSSDGDCYSKGYYAYFWSSMEFDSYNAYRMYLDYDYGYAYLNNYDKDYGFSVRCIKDDASGQTAQSSSSSAESSSSSVIPGSSGDLLSSSSAKSSSSKGEGESSSAMVSSSSAESSSSSVTLATRCKTESKDNCEYGELVDERDGQAYKTVKIGDQWWMAENLNYDTASGYCYNDSTEYCAKYGRLYDWATVMDSAGIWSTNGKGCGYDKTCSPTYPVRGICPSGWHLPSKTEWETLFIAVGGSSVAGWVLKSTSGWNNSGNGSDAFGFSALPAGRRYDKGNYAIEGEGARIWSSTEQNNGGSVYDLCLYDDDNKAFLLNGDKEGGFSVRCVKD